MHGRVTVLVLHVNIGTLCHQQLHQVSVALRHRQLQRRLVTVVADVDVASSLWKISQGKKYVDFPLEEKGRGKSKVLLNFFLDGFERIICSGLQLTSLMRISATSRWLLRAARCSAEKPSSFLTSTSCRARARIFSVALPPGQTTQDPIRQSQHSSWLKLRTVMSNRYPSAFSPSCRLLNLRT